MAYEVVGCLWSELLAQFNDRHAVYRPHAVVNSTTDFR